MFLCFFLLFLFRVCVCITSACANKPFRKRFRGKPHAPRVCLFARNVRASVFAFQFFWALLSHFVRLPARSRDVRDVGALWRLRCMLHIRRNAIVNDKMPSIGRRTRASLQRTWHGHGLCRLVICSLFAHDESNPPPSPRACKWEPRCINTMLMSGIDTDKHTGGGDNDIAGSGWTHMT